MGGGTRATGRQAAGAGGLSPRGRGNHLPSRRITPAGRSIPAWAGEPLRCQPISDKEEVYPRVGGGTPDPVSAGWRHGGLSPRGRGNRNADAVEVQLKRSIPAWAGEPVIGAGRVVGLGVYPRVGGGTRAASNFLDFHRGLSPRGRGNRDGADYQGKGRRSIPAWAGEPSATPAMSGFPPVYPRVGGGTGLARRQMGERQGLSPRGRGNLKQDTYEDHRNRSIPAWAGEPPLRPGVGRRGEVYPRVGGGTIAQWRIGKRAAGLSPRGRGNLQSAIVL